ncbi:hypothetical protein [Saccharothrix deserti]|uniref:hypothetical protein n=1 Tax=Saccharothrix deserti TaxID=2593674 RepID=UPI00131D02BD|nr:hypothetical protein [Saccharothrix deserti]
MGALAAIALLALFAAPSAGGDAAPVILTVMAGTACLVTAVFGVVKALQLT